MTETETATAEPITPFRTLILVWAALLAGTVVTVWASTIHLGRLNVWIALGIAACKASLVLAIFMRLRQESRLFFLMFLLTIVTLATFIGLTFLDVSFR